MEHESGEFDGIKKILSIPSNHEKPKKEKIEEEDDFEPMEQIFHEENIYKEPPLILEHKPELKNVREPISINDVQTSKLSDSLPDFKNNLETPKHKYVKEPSDVPHTKPLPLKLVDIASKGIDDIGKITELGAAVSTIGLGSVIGATKLTSNIISDTKNLLNIQKDQFFKNNLGQNPNQNQMTNSDSKLRQVAIKLVKDFPEKKSKVFHKIATDYSPEDVIKILSYASKDPDLPQKDKDIFSQPGFQENVYKNYKVDRSSPLYLKKWSNVQKPNHSKIGDSHYDLLKDIADKTHAPSPASNEQKEKAILNKEDNNPLPSAVQNLVNDHIDARESKEQRLKSLMNDISNQSFSSKNSFFYGTKNNELSEYKDKFKEILKLNNELGNPNPEDFKSFKNIIKQRIQERFNDDHKNHPREVEYRTLDPSYRSKINDDNFKYLKKINNFNGPIIPGLEKATKDIETKRDPRFVENEELSNLVGEEVPKHDLIDILKQNGGSNEHINLLERHIVDRAIMHGNTINDEIVSSNEALKNEKLPFVRSDTGKFKLDLTQNVYRKVPGAPPSEDYGDDQIDATPSELGTKYNVIPGVGIEYKSAAQLEQESGQIFPGHPAPTQNQNNIFQNPPGSSIAEVNYGIDPVLPASDLISEIGKNLAFKAGNLAGAAYAHTVFGPQGAFVFSSLYNNFLKQIVQQNQPYKGVAEDVSNQIESSAQSTYRAFTKKGKKETKKQEEKDFIDGNSNPKKRSAEDGIEDNAGGRMVRARSEFSPIGNEAANLNRMTTVNDLNPVSASVTDIFAPRQTTNLVRQAQLDFETWGRNSQDYPVQN